MDMFLSLIHIWQLIKAFLDEADMSADVIKTVDFPPAYGADIVVSLSLIHIYHIYV